MAKLGKQKIFVGKVYKDNWGDVRIPIVVREITETIKGIDFAKREVHYVQKRKRDSDWYYRPDIYVVGETQFALKFQEQKTELTEIQLEQVCKHAQKFFKVYFGTLDAVKKDLTSVLKSIK